jgi:ankyrin repeat protein
VHEVVARLLLEKGANINAEGGYYKMTALHLAADKGHEAVARLLLRKGANANAKDRDRDGWTALKCATDKGHEAVRRLFQPHSLSPQSYTPLSHRRRREYANSLHSNDSTTAIWPPHAPAHRPPESFGLRDVW